MSKRSHITALNRANNSFREWKASKKATEKWKPFLEWKQELIKKGKWIEKPKVNTQVKSIEPIVLLRRNKTIISKL